MKSCKIMKYGGKVLRTPRSTLILLLAVCLTAGTPLPAAAEEASARVSQALQGLQAAAGGKIRTTRSPLTALTTFIAGESGQLIPVSAPPNSTPEERALRFLATHGAAFGVSGGADVQVKRVESADLVGMDHVRLQQVHEGVPVTAGELMVHLRGANVVSASARTLPDLGAPRRSPERNDCHSAESIRC